MAIQKLEKGGVTYYTLCIQCPVCRSKGVTTPNYEWIHYGCGGESMLGDNAMVLCTKCGHTHPVVTTKWSCPQHDSTGTSFEQAGVEVIAEVLSCAGMLTQTAGKEWLIRCLQNL